MENNLYERLLITFHSTTQALHAEEELTCSGIEGRLIPLPSGISADCGMGFMCKPHDRSAVEQTLLSAGITAAGFYRHTTRS